MIIWLASYYEFIKSMRKKRLIGPVPVFTPKIEGLSALRRPAVASVIGLDAHSKKKVTKAVSPYWENAFSLQRELFSLKNDDADKRKEIFVGLKFLSESADEAVLQVLATDQIDRLATLLTVSRGTKQPNEPRKVKKLNRPKSSLKIR